MVRQVCFCRFSRTSSGPALAFLAGVRTDYPRHIEGFNYLGEYRYFLTFCCDRRRKAFTVPDAVALVTTHFMRAAEEEEFAIVACCFMPDHAHLVAEGLEDHSDLKRFISRAKQLSGYHYKQQFNERL